MAKPVISLLLICTVAVILAATGNGEAAAPAAAAPSTICKVTVSELMECLPAITGKCPPPTTSCCAVIRKADLNCLCNYKAKLKSIGVNPVNAMALPGKCGLKVPRACKKKLLH